jgi:hypothetical protein
MTKRARPGAAAWCRGAAAIVWASLAAGCTSLPQDVVGLSGYLHHPQPSVRAAAGDRLGRSGDPRAVPPLLEALRDRDARVRRSAAAALGRLRQPDALGPLVRTGGGDRDAKARRAAAEAVTWLGPDPDGQRAREVRAQLLRGLPELRLEGVALQRAVGFLGHEAGVSIHVNWRGLSTARPQGEQRLTVHARDLTFAEAFCRVLAAADAPMGFIISPSGYPVEVAPVKELTDLVKAERRRRARAAELRQWALATDAGRETMQKLQVSVGVPALRDVQLADAVQYLREITGARFVVDWDALAEAGIQRSAVLSVDLATSGRKLEGPGAAALAIPTVEAGLWRILPSAARTARRTEYPELEFVVDGQIVFISTRGQIGRRIAPQDGARK